MLRDIILYGVPSLVEKSEPVEEFGDDLRQLAQDMIETMRAAAGVGLAAPQVAVNLRLCVVDATSGREPDRSIVLVNPEIISREGSQVGEEGCLSIPGFTAMVDRPYRITVRARDLHGEEFELETEDFEARAICHEIDHLDGILYLDRISRLKAEMIKRKIRKKMKAGQWL